MPVTRRLGGLLLAALFASIASSGLAWAGQYAKTESPLWRVGTLDKKLSAACRRGAFNQRRVLVITIAYAGKKGWGITGVAKKGFNLRDPKGLAEPGLTYHFFHDRYSNCRVYVAGKRLTR